MSTCDPRGFRYDSVRNFRVDVSFSTRQTVPETITTGASTVTAGLGMEVSACAY